MKTIKLQISEYRCWLQRYYRRQKLHYRGNPSTAYSIPTVLPQRSQGKSVVLPPLPWYYCRPHYCAAL